MKTVLVNLSITRRDAFRAAQPHHGKRHGNEWLHSEGAAITAHENTRKHLCVAMRMAAWQWRAAGGEPLSINGLPPGPYKVMIEPEVIDGLQIEGTFRARQVPLSDPAGESRTSHDARKMAGDLPTRGTLR